MDRASQRSSRRYEYTHDGFLSPYRHPEHPQPTGPPPPVRTPSISSRPLSRTGAAARPPSRLPSRPLTAASAATRRSTLYTEHSPRSEHAHTEGSARSSRHKDRQGCLSPHAREHHAIEHEQHPGYKEQKRWNYKPHHDYLADHQEQDYRAQENHGHDHDHDHEHVHEHIYQRPPTPYHPDRTLGPSLRASIRRSLDRIAHRRGRSKSRERYSDTWYFSVDPEIEAERRSRSRSKNRSRSRDRVSSTWYSSVGLEERRLRKGEVVDREVERLTGWAHGGIYSDVHRERGRKRERYRANQSEPRPHHEDRTFDREERKLRREWEKELHRRGAEIEQYYGHEYAHAYDYEAYAPHQHNSHAPYGPYESEPHAHQDYPRSHAAHPPRHSHRPRTPRPPPHSHPHPPHNPSTILPVNVHPLVPPRTTFHPPAGPYRGAGPWSPVLPDTRIISGPMPSQQLTVGTYLWTRGVGYKGWYL